VEVQTSQKVDLEELTEKVEEFETRSKRDESSDDLHNFNDLSTSIHLIEETLRSTRGRDL